MKSKRVICDVGFYMVFRLDPLWSQLPPELVKMIQFHLEEVINQCESCKVYFYEMATYPLADGVSFSCCECSL